MREEVSACLCIFFNVKHKQKAMHCTW